MTNRVIGLAGFSVWEKVVTTTQKANEELISATQKEESTTQKSIIATPKPLTATQKEILEYLHEHPTATRQEVAKVIDNITEDGVVKNGRYPFCENGDIRSLLPVQK